MPEIFEPIADLKRPPCLWNFPPELAAIPNWVLWSADKIPLQPNGKPAKSNDPTTWSTLDEVLAVAGQFDNRIGFMFREADGLVGIDLDGAVTEGAIAPWAQEIVESLNSYTEFSPSGTGIHVITQGRLPDARGRKTKIGEPSNGRQPGIEIYNHGRYFTFTGDTIGGEVRAAQAELDRLLATHWPAANLQRPAGHRAASQGSLVERIRSYLRNIEPAVSGQRGHDSTMWAARCLITGFRLTIEEAWPYFAEWNASCLPPWSEKELQHKLESAAATPCDKPEGWLLTEIAPPSASNVAINLRPSPAVKKPARGGSSAFPTECLRVPGLIGDIADYNLATALYPQPELALAGAIALMSVLCGGKVKDEKFGTRPNVYVVGVEKTSAGKENARRVNKAILSELNADHMTEDDIGSDAGFIDWVADTLTGLVQIDEMHGLLISMRNIMAQPQMAAVGDCLLKLYTASNSDYRTKLLRSQKRKTIRYPSISLYGTCTTRGFWENITFQNIDGGLLGRCMVFEGRGYVASQDLQSLPIPESILVRARGWLELKTHGGNLAGTSGQNHTPLIILHTEDAFRRARQHQQDIDARVMEGEDDLRAAIWKRTAEKTNKLALLFACSRCGTEYAPTITLDDVNRAIKVSNWLTRSMLRQLTKYVAETDFEKTCNRFVEFLNQRGVVTGHEISRSPSPIKKLKPREKREVIEATQEAGDCFVEALPANGHRPGIAYYSRDSWQQKLSETPTPNAI